MPSGKIGRIPIKATYRPSFSRSTAKYGNRKVEVDGIKFDSQKEAKRYAELTLMQKAGLIRNLMLQVPYELIPKQLDKDGKVAERAVVYRADFVYETNLGKRVVEDVKSPATRTDEYIIKRKLMRYVHGIIIREV